jgi:predicted O-methyltransferase YrrM
VSPRARVFLDDLTPRFARVGYGELGRNGHLGYEGKPVMVAGRSYSHALSAHSPASLVFELDGGYTSFHTRVTINGDVPPGRSHASFSVFADGRRVAVAPYVAAGEPPRPIAADVTGARRLELVTDTTAWEFSHAVWLQPELRDSPVDATPVVRSDCLGRADILLPEVTPSAERCMATVVSPGFEQLLDDMLGSFLANGGCSDALVVVFGVGDSSGIDQVVAKYGATLVRCRPRVGVNATVKSVLYTVPHVVDADRFLCLDADMLVLGDLNPVFDGLDACRHDALLACREGNGHGYSNLRHALCTVYGGRERDLRRLLGRVDREGDYELVVNDGLFAGRRQALFALDGFIRRMPEAARWIDENADIWWRNQFVFNLALASLGCGVELDAVYNLQLNSQEVWMGYEHGRMRAVWWGREVRVLHFNGLGRSKYPEFRDRFAGVADPLAGQGDGDGYAVFVAALRAWIGRYGLAGFAWSLYGTADGLSARVPDPSVFPLLALLHYLVRSNGCVAVLETGTGRGVSAACLASAVAHRDGGRVVTFDPEAHAEREDLWAGLPARMRDRIDARPTDSLAGMAALRDAGERFDAALLDSVHHADHVWAEFQLAAELVNPGGLILIHDVLLEAGTVGEAVDRIADAGYGVARLWTADSGVPEGDRLGLAVIENRRRPGGDG